MTEEQRKKARIRQRRWKVAHKEQVVAASRAYWFSIPEDERKKRSREKWKKQKESGCNAKWRKKNKKRINANARKWYHTVGRDRATYRKYGITFSVLFAAQGQVCAICSSNTHRGQGWHVDHCHFTNRVRGILCSPCNSGIGLLKDSPQLLEKAIIYLKKEQ